MKPVLSKRFWIVIGFGLDFESYLCKNGLSNSLQTEDEENTFI